MFFAISITFINAVISWGDMQENFTQKQESRFESKQEAVFSSLANMNAMLLFYYTAFALFLIGNCAASTTSSNTFIPSFKLALQIAAIALLLLKVAFDRFGLRQMALFIPISLAFAYSGHICSDYSLLWGWLFIFTGRDVKLVNLARIALLIFLSSFVITVALSVIGVLPNLVIYRGDTPYHTFGFTHINSLGLVIYEIVIAAMILKYPRYGFGDMFYCIAAFILIFVMTGSRTSMLCVAAAFAMILLVRSGLAAKHERGLLWILELLFIFEILFSLCFLFADPSAGGFFGAIDKLFSNRVYYAHYYFQNYGIKLFGNNFEGFESLAAGGYYIEGFIIDNAYCHAILVNGLIPYLIMIVLIFLSYRKMRIEGHFTAIAMALSLFSFVGLSEASALNFYTAYALVALVPTFFGTSFYSFGCE